METYFIALIVVLVLALLFWERISLRLLILRDIPRGKASWNDLRDTTDYRGRRLVIAEAMLRAYIESPLIRAFVSEHEGEETHGHIVELFSFGEGQSARLYLFDVGAGRIKVTNGKYVLLSSAMDFMYDVYRELPYMEPVAVARRVIADANRTISYHDKHRPFGE